jgi:hypothetical protein
MVGRVMTLFIGAEADEGRWSSDETTGDGEVSMALVMKGLKGEGIRMGGAISRYGVEAAHLWAELESSRWRGGAWTEGR